MTADFVHMISHVGNAPGSLSKARMVLSRLPAGESLIHRSAISVKFVLDGDETYIVNGRSYRVQPGQLLVVQPSPEPMTVQLPRPGGAGLCVYLPDGGYEVPPYAGEMLLDGPVMLAAAGTSLGRVLTGAARQLARKPDIGPEMASIVTRRASESFASLLIESDGRLRELEAVKPSTRRELVRRVELARGYLHAVQDRAVSLQELADHANTSPFHLARTFRQMYGVPPGVYHRQLRLDRLGKRLRSEELGLAAAAAELGFADQAGFTKAFKRHFGLPPGEWLRRYARAA